MKFKIKYVQAYTDRHGKFRIYFSRPGQKKIPLPGPIGSEPFLKAYHAAMEVVPVPVINKGSFSDLIARYYHSPAFKCLAPSTSKNYRLILEKFRNEHGEKPVALLERKHLSNIIGKMGDTPAAANRLLKLLRMLLDLAIDQDMIKVNPAHGLKGLKTKVKGFHSWTEEEIQQFETRHRGVPLLAMRLMLYTGQRRSDAVKMGWKDVTAETILVRQQKTGAVLQLPIHPVLWEMIKDLPQDQPTFLMTQWGKPFTANGIGNAFRDWCNEAGLPECTSHGLRKAMARRLAEAGCSTELIKSITGHASDKEVGTYTKAADQIKMAKQAMTKIKT